MEVMEFMSDATDIPILLDADTGYGNFNNARRLVTKLEQRGVAGACIEDKLFPKTNSLLDGRAQPLADIDEFCAKIKACKGTECPSFVCLLGLDFVNFFCVLMDFDCILVQTYKKMYYQYPAISDLMLHQQHISFQQCTVKVCYCY